VLLESLLCCGTYRVAGLGRTAAAAWPPPSGSHRSRAAVHTACADSMTHAPHICTPAGAAVLVLAALAALVIEHGPRVLSRSMPTGVLALSESIAETLPKR
jgi:hypothetical protein